MDILSLPAAPDTTPARHLGPQQRLRLAHAALAGRPLAALAREHGVSRKFVARQRRRAERALADAFTPPAPGEDILFTLPVTRPWLRSLVLALALTCHSSVRGTQGLLRDLFDYPLAVGTIHGVLRQAAAVARQVNARQELSAVRLAAHDEIFQAGRPVLVGADVASTYCYLLRQEDHRDADTWAVHLWDLQARGLAPLATVADGGTGLRAGQALAWPGTPCRADVFHPERDFGQLVRYLENRAYAALAAADRLQRRAARPGAPASCRERAAAARREAERAVALADDVAVLEGWLRRDVLAVAGPPLADRRALFDYVVAELRARTAGCPHRIGPVARQLARARDDLLAFAADLDRDLADLAAYCRVPPGLARALLEVPALPAGSAVRWAREAQLRQALGGRYHEVAACVAELASAVVRASSVVENLNSRLRGSFFLRRQLGPGYLDLLQCYLNYHRFVRSERPDRAEKSPAELLSGVPQPHWLEQLGYRPFRRVA